MFFEVSVNGRPYTVQLTRAEGTLWTCRIGEREFTVDAIESGRGTLSVIIDGRSFAITLDAGGQSEKLVLGGESYAVEVRDPRALRDRAARAGRGEGTRNVTSPMPGKIVRVLAPAGTRVEAGAGVLVIEAMKMQNEIKSPKAGVVQSITVAEGAAVNAGDVVAVVE
jgi:biotin carboxyl carrier protein